jgi:hypothetical protein
LAEFGVEQIADTSERRTVPVAYRYILLDDNESEILAYHWHPTGSSPVVTPHLHVSARHLDLDLSPAHLPTGIVSPVAFIRTLITEFGAEPLRPDWGVILVDE